MVRFTIDGDGAFLHCLQQGGLRFRRSAIDLIGENKIVKYGPRLKTELALALTRVIDLRSGNVRRQQIRCELDSRKPGIEKLAELLDRACLRQPRQPLDKQISVRQEPNQQAFDHRLLPKNRFTDLLL